MLQRRTGGLMVSYSLRRFFLIIPTLFFVSLIVFLSVRFIPGDAIDLMVNQLKGSTTGDIQLSRNGIRQALGLNDPLPTQYWHWLRNAVQGNLGHSLWSGKSVTTLIFERLPVSLELGLLAIIIGLMIAVPIGVFSAVRQDTLGDYIARTFSILCISLPAFWVATLVIVYPSIWWDWSPQIRYFPLTQYPWQNLLQFIIPSFIMGMALSGTTMRMTRSMMLEVLRQDYIRTAWAKGLNERVVLVRHAIKNALIPVITAVALQIPLLVGGTVVVEEVFSLPGLGTLMIDAIGKRDYPIISAITLLLSIVVLVVNLLVDMLYSYLDPRIRYH